MPMKTLLKNANQTIMDLRLVLKNTHRMKKENGKIQITDKIGINYTDQKQEDICLLENAWFFIQLFQKYIIISCWWNLTIMSVRILSQNPWKLCKENGHKRDNTGARRYLRM